jgi:hypothetical protein
MNPGGKIVPPYQRMSENLRFRAATQVPETWCDYSDEGGWDGAVEKCNGMVVCRKLDAGTMCPSFQVTLEEQNSTRGRANALREAMLQAADAAALHQLIAAWQPDAAGQRRAAA